MGKKPMTRSHLTVPCLLLLAAALSPPTTVAGEPRDLALHCGSVLDMRSDRLQKNITILVSGGRIEDMGRTAKNGGTLRVPPGIFELDLVVANCGVRRLRQGEHDEAKAPN